MAEYINPRAQACQNCVKAKAKCYGHTAAGRCERCNRLGKDCFMQTPVVRKRKTVKATHLAQAERIAELEARLNSLASTLGTSQSSSSNNPTSALVSSTTSVPSENASHSRALNHASMLSPAASHNPGIDHQWPISEKDPDELLDTFRRDLARQVPFISIPPHVNAKAFAHEKPFLYQAVVFAASYHDSVHQMTLGQEFLKNLTEHVVLMGQKTLDSLQGILVYITWYNNLFHGSSQMTFLLGLAFSLVIDLYLYVPSTTPDKHEKFLDEMKGIVTCYQASWARAPLSREEERVVLGCFYLFPSVSTAFSRFNPLHWTSNIQYAYDDIRKNPENQNETLLVYLAELSRILEDIKHAGMRSYPAHQRGWNPAIAVQFKLLTSELYRFKVSLPESLQNDSLMVMHYHAVEMFLFESGFSMPPTTIVHEPLIQRADALLLCLRAIEALTDLFFSIGVKPYIHFCPIMTSYIYFAMMTLSKMCLFEAEDWDFSKVGSKMSLSSLVKKLVQLMDDTSARYDLNEARKPWEEVSRRMKLVTVRFERLLASKDQLQASLAQPTTETGDLDGVSYFINQFDLLDEEFWQNLTVGNDFMYGIDGNV